jgi:hypothetical protein
MGLRVNEITGSDVSRIRSASTSSAAAGLIDFGHATLQEAAREVTAPYLQYTYPLEVSFLTTKSLTHWRHAAPYDFHFSEDHRAKFDHALRTGEWIEWRNPPR